MLVNFSSEGIQQLKQVSRFSDQEIEQFSEVLYEAKQREGSAKAFLNSLSTEELNLLQRANGLAEPIQIGKLSTEGAQNLLVRPDSEDLVDLDNDGIIEVGLAQTFQYPPLNAPAFVKAAWQKATEGLSWSEKMYLNLNMHMDLYGTGVSDTGQKTPLPPEQQWSKQGIEALFKNIYSCLEFYAEREGWTEENLRYLDVYKKYEAELAGGQLSAAGVEPSNTQPTASPKQNTQQPSAQEQQLDKLNQLALDARFGVDREKLEELEQQMQAVENDPSLTNAQKQAKLQELMDSKTHIQEEALRRTVEDEKRKARLGGSNMMLETLKAVDSTNPQQRSRTLSW